MTWDLNYHLPFLFVLFRKILIAFEYCSKKYLIVDLGVFQGTLAFWLQLSLENYFPWNTDKNPPKYHMTRKNKQLLQVLHYKYSLMLTIIPGAVRKIISIYSLVLRLDLTISLFSLLAKLKSNSFPDGPFP